MVGKSLFISSLADSHVLSLPYALDNEAITSYLALPVSALSSQMVHLPQLPATVATRG